MSSRKTMWRGIVPYARRFFYGGVKAPMVKRMGNNSTPTNSKNYEGLDRNYRWFRQDELVRRCIIINAAYATMAAGFKTEIEPIQDMAEEQKQAFVKQYKYVKDFIDTVNRKVNLDHALFVAQVKRSIYGKCGFEIILEAPNGAPSWLLSLQSTSEQGTKLEPELNENWELTGFKYNGEHKYAPQEVLYFANLELENDHLGLSDIEPIASTCKARNYLLEKDFPEITERLWAPYVHMQADTSGMSDADETAFLQGLVDSATSGKSTAYNKSVTSTVVALNINLAGLVQLMDKLEETIIRAFGTPRFLINKTPENRATAYVEFEAYISGPIANTQRYFKREIERQWYEPLVRLALAKNNQTGEVPVRIKHVWKPIRTSDIYAMATAVAALYSNGQGILAKYPEFAFDMMGWDKTKIPLANSK